MEANPVGRLYVEREERAGRERSASRHGGTKARKHGELTVEDSLDAQGLSRKAITLNAITMAEFADEENNARLTLVPHRY